MRDGAPKQQQLRDVFLLEHSGLELDRECRGHSHQQCGLTTG